MRIRWLLPAILFLISARPAAAKGEFSFNGYVKLLHETDYVRVPDTFLSGQLLHQRLMMRYDAGEHLYIRTDLRIRLFRGHLYESRPYFGESLKHPEKHFRPEILSDIDRQKITVFAEADRAYAGYQKGAWDVRVGKQRINWGTNLVWNPNDLFNAYNILDFDYEERPGTDAVRIQYDLRDRRAAEVAYAPGKFGSTVAAGIYRTHLKTYDLQFSFGSYRRQAVAGLGWAGNILEAGFKGEINRYFPEAGKSAQTCFSSTVDYTFKGDWYLFVSCLWQEKAAESSDAFTSASPVILLSPKQLMPFRMSAYCGAMKELSPKWSLQLAAIYGGTSSNLIAFPGVTWRLADDLELLLTGQAYFSRQEEDWGNRADALFLRLKYNFEGY
ncbi:MAG: hypothetical protein RL213_1806 [Bacteroidota bacterium]|jgi:hypothetical protein